MKYVDELNRRFGQAVRDNVVRDIAQGRGIGPRGIGRTVVILSAAIALTPYLVGALGIALVLLNLDSIPAIAIGALLVAAGYYLRAPRVRNRQKTLRRAQAPALFALLDKISGRLGAPTIDGIHIDGDFNAYMAEFGRQERVLGIGAPLWLALDPPERLSVLAHEIAHLVNRDPARAKLTSGALETLWRWHDLSRPPELVDHETGTTFYYDDRGVIDRLFGAVFGGIVAAMAKGFETLIYAESQRAEYLADTASASIAGADAVNRTLKKTILSPLAVQAVRDIYFDGSQKIDALRQIAAAVRDADPGKAEKLYVEAVEELLTVDSSHPPTRYRMEVVGALGAPHPSLDPGLVDWKTIDEELAPFLEEEEQKLLSRLIVQ